MNSVICLLLYSGFTSFSTIFQTYPIYAGHTEKFGCGWEHNAHFQSAASLKYHTLDIWHNIPHSHIILTLNWPILIPSSPFLMLSTKHQFLSLWYDSAGDQTRNFPVTKRMLYQLSHCAGYELSLSVLRFNSPVNLMGSCWAQSVYLTTRLLGRLSLLSD